MTDRPSELKACPKCKAPCTTRIHQRSGDWGWGTTDAERTTYHYAAPADPVVSAECWRRAISDWNGDHPRDPDAAYLKRIEQHATKLAREWK
jgi:hypothetical protein